MKKSFFLLIFLYFGFIGFTQNQINCDEVVTFLDNVEKRILNINTTDPELITLHYLFTLDIESELQEFYKSSIPFLSQCPSIDFNKTINTYDWARNVTQILKDSLSKQKELVDQMFFQNGFIEYQLMHYSESLYLIDRSLQFKPLQADPLLLKLEILFKQRKYEECIEVLNSLYYLVQLNETQEKQTIDFNLKFYDELYHIGDSLVKIDKSIDAFKIFGLLETFCNNMPSGYCNDDYYHGLLRSKVGVYESYLKIAAVARERGNIEMEKKFSQYAHEYLEENKDLIIEMNLSDKNNQSTLSDIKNVENTINTQNTKPQDPQIITKKSNEEEPLKTKTDTIKNKDSNQTETNKKGKEKNLVKNQKNNIIVINREDPIDTTAMIYKRYQDIVSEAIELCIKKEFDAAFDQFLAAQELEKCNCFPKDARIELFLSELRKIRSN